MSVLLGKPPQPALPQRTIRIDEDLLEYLRRGRLAIKSWVVESFALALVYFISDSPYKINMGEATLPPMAGHLVPTRPEESGSDDEDDQDDQWDAKADDDYPVQHGTQHHYV